MRSDIRAMAWIISATLMAACSSTPRTAGPEAGSATSGQPVPQKLAAASTAPAAAAPGASAPAAAASTAASTAAVPAGEVDPALVKSGYSVMKRHGEVLYCRNEIITGERIGTRVCLTAGQIQHEKDDVAKAKDLMMNHSNRCMPADGCN